MYEERNPYRLIGAHVQNPACGEGIIRDIIEANGKYYVLVSFSAPEREKKYMADYAFAQKSLVIDDAELNALALELFGNTSQKDGYTALGDGEAREKNGFKNPQIDAIVRKVLAGESIALDLISLYDDELFEKELLREAFEYLERLVLGTPLAPARQACVVCACSLIALKYYDGDLHSYIEQKFRENCVKEEKYTSGMIQNAVRKATSEYRNSIKYFDPNSCIAVPLVLCCVPHYRVKDLFVISYDIYKKKCLFDEDISDEQITEKVAETFSNLRRKDLISDADSIKGTNYLMSKYTQSCIYSGVEINALVQIVTTCIRLIISSLTRPEDSFNIPAYYYEGYNAWVDYFNSDGKEKSKYEQNRNISQPYLRLVHNTVHLFTGKFIMDEFGDPNDVHICVYNGDTLLEDIHLVDPNAIEYMDGEDVMGGYAISKQEIAVHSSPIGELSYSIVCGGKKLYDSKGRLFRKVIFFDGKGNEVKPGSDYVGEVFVVSQDAISEEYGDNSKEIYERDGFHISTIMVNNHDVYVFDDEPYVFYKISAAQLISYEVPWGFFLSVEGKKHNICKSISILVPASCEHTDLLMEIDGKQYDYNVIDEDGVAFSAQVFSKDHNELWVYLIKVMNLTPGYHFVRVFNGRSKKQIKGAQFYILYDPETAKTYKGKDDNGTIYEIKSSFIDTQPIIFQPGTPQKEIKAFANRLGVGRLICYPSTFSFSVDGKEWEDILSKGLCLYDIPDSIDAISICGPSGMKAYYLDAEALVKRQELNLETDEKYASLYRLHLSFLRTKNENKTKIAFEFGNKTRYVGIWHTPYVIRDECKFFFDKERNKHVFIIRFDGKSKIEARIYPLHSDLPILSKAISSGDTVEIDKDLIPSDTKYLTVSLHARKHDTLFDSFQKVPFMSFPKYSLFGNDEYTVDEYQSNHSYSEKRRFIRLIPYPPQITLSNGHLVCKLRFKGANSVRAEIVPTGFKTPVYTTIVYSDEWLRFDVTESIFSSYCLNLYEADESGKNGEVKIPFFVSKPIPVKPTLLKRTFSIFEFKMDDGSFARAIYSLHFSHVVEIDRKYYIIATMINNRNGNRMPNYLVKIESISDSRIEIELYELRGRSVKPMIMQSGRTVIGAVIERTSKA